MKTNINTKIRGINADLKTLFREQETLTNLLSKTIQEHFEMQSKINTLLLEKTNFKILKKVIQNDVLTTKDVAKWLGYSISKLYRLRTYEGLPYTKVGKKIMYRRKAIQAYLNEREKTNKSNIFQ